MGLLDRLRKGRRTPDPSAAGLSREELLARWRYVLRTAPAEAFSAAHAEGLGALGDDARAELLHRLRAALSAREPGEVIPAEPAALVRAAIRAERRAPGFLERALATDARGRQVLGGLAAAVVGALAMAPYLRGFEPGLGSQPLSDPRAPDFDLETPEPYGHTASHDDDLDDED